MAATTTSSIALRTKVEATFGTSPGGSGWTLIRKTGETLSPNASYTESEEIRSDGQIGAVVRTDAEGGGQINGELPYGEWDDWLEAVTLSSAWTAVPVSITSTATMAAVDATTVVPANFTDSAQDLSVFTTGMWFKMAGWTGSEANNNELYKVVAGGVSGTVYVDGNPNFVAVGSTSDTVVVTQFAEVSNGKTLRTWTIERQDTDDADDEEYHVYTGAGIASLALEIPTTGILTTVWEILSKIPSSPTSSTAVADNSQTSTEPFTAAQMVRFYEGDPKLEDITGNGTTDGTLWSTTPFKVLGMTLNVSNGLRSRKAWGVVGPALAHGRGDISVTGTLRLYYNATAGGAGADRDDYILFRKVLNDTVSGIALTMRDGSNNMYVIDMPRVKFTSGTRNAPAKSQDVVLELEFQAYQNPDDLNPNSGVTGTTIRFARGSMAAVGG